MNTLTIKQNGSNLIEAKEIYHTFNRTNNGEILFKSEIDHKIFLDAIKKYLSNFVDFIAHNLIPNHFHLMYSVKSLKEITKYVKSLDFSEMCITDHKFLASDKTNHDIDMIICNQFRRAFISYSENMNLSHNRKGNLLCQNAKTKVIPSEMGQKITLRYINCNTVKHSMDILPEDHEWSSYNDFFDDGMKIVNMKLAMTYFKDIKDVENYHREFIELHAAYLLKKKELKALEASLIPGYLR